MLAKKAKARASSTKVNTSNTPYLVVVESPSKCAKIEKYLGFQYRCIASKGHIREIAKVANAKEHYTIEFELIPEKADHVSWMKTIVSHFDKNNIFIATDDDREGEGIGWHICQVCNLDVHTTKRILFHEVTQIALLKAIQNPMQLRMNIVHAQQARQVLDRMIGFQISPILSRLIVHDNSKFLSAGRCQTPTLRLIYDRYQESLSKIESLHYKIVGRFLPHPSTFEGTLNKIYETEELLLAFLEKSKTFSHKLEMKMPKVKSNGPPKPFNTSNLLQFGSNALHMSPKHVIDCCQSLYQEGHITYMRTESKQYAKGFLSQIEKIIEDQYGNQYIGELQKLENSDSNNPHEAIRVTNLDVRFVEHKDKKASEVYKLIWTRTMESCMSSYDHKDHDIHVSAPDETHYKSTIEIPHFLGWKRIHVDPKEMTKVSESKTIQIHYIERYNGKKVSFNKIDCTIHMKDLDKYYNEASLIQKLEAIGVGRPSTYSMLVETIQVRKYVEKENIEGEMIEQNEYTLQNNEIETNSISKTFGAAKNKLRIQDLGIQSIDLLYKHFEPIFSYDYTSQMERDLDKLIEDPTIPWYSVCEVCDKTIDQCLKPIKMKMCKVYSIDEEHEFIFGKAGAMIRVKGSKTYKSLKKDLEIDFEKLENEEYTLNELIEIENPCLGIYKNEEVIIKNGPYGAYVNWGNKTVSLKSLGKKKLLKDITIEMVIQLLEENKTKEEKNTTLRELDGNTSVRNGKFGMYVFYKTENMNKPKFINIKKCPLNVLEDSKVQVLQWVQKTIQK
jgi:DNA topoisomerase-1